ncbi:MAG: AAA family ATPase [Promicromonosporaceae bacterium]|nr:AAA family ATPase [Promicromonosporaceae bacterium]
MPVIELIAGPNGAGKSTFVHRLLQPRTHLPFINADQIATELWPGSEVENAHRAAAVAVDQRNDAMVRGESFITETVFSHHSKLDLVKMAIRVGYEVNLSVILIPLDNTIHRVSERVARGGHQVPTSKIISRYGRLWRLIAEASLLTDRTDFYDNSSASSPFQLVATLEYGRMVGTPNWPMWTPPELHRVYRG